MEKKHEEAGAERRAALEKLDGRVWVARVSSPEDKLPFHPISRMPPKFGWKRREAEAPLPRQQKEPTDLVATLSRERIFGRGSVP